ncbi:MAG TPA: hypothetical protein VGB38_03265, partial [bacterium]
MNRIQTRSRERGALSPFILIFLVTLAIMSTATYYMVAGESQNLGGSMASVQAEYAALSGVFFALSALNAETFDSAVEATTYSIADVEVSLDTVKISGQRSFYLRSVAEKN